MVTGSASTADIRMQNVIGRVRMALEAEQPLLQAQYLADAQQMIGWALRSMVEECRETDHSWRLIASELAVAHDALYRQYQAGGPVLATGPFYRSGTRNDRWASQLVVAFRTAEDGRLHVGSERDIRALPAFDVVLRRD